LLRGLKWIPAFGLFLGMALAGCGPTRRADLVFINGSEPQTLDPAQISGQLETRLANALFEGLTTRNAAGEVVPGVATHWEVSPDGLVWTFHLRDNARWSNGEPLTSRDFLESWKRILEPKTASVYAEILFFIKNARAYQKGQLADFSQVGIAAPDARTLQVTLENPTPFFPDLAAFTTYLPVPLAVIAKFGGSWTKPENIVTNGAYLLQDWRINDRVELKKNPLYWDAANVQLERIDALATSQGTTAVNLYLTGEADLILDKGLIPASILADLRRRPDFHSFNFLGTYFYRVNVTQAPTDKLLVRKALAAAIDRQSIVQKITRGGEAPATGLIPPGIPGYQSPEGIGYNPDQARAWLAEAGYPGGKGLPPVSILYNSSQAHAAIAVEVQAMWQRELGIRAELRPQEWATYLKDLDGLNYQVARSSWVGDYNDPKTFLDCFLAGAGNNRTGWVNPAYDGLLARADREPDSAKRFGYLKQAEALLVAEDVPIIPLYHYVGMLCYDADKFGGIQGNLVDEHPLRCMYRKP
jgi:oligopeptide transport system substrate-binding protein